MEAKLLPGLNSLHARSGGVLAEYGRHVPWEYNDFGPSNLEEWKIEKTIWRIEIWGKLSFGNEENRKEKVTFLSLLLKDSTYLY